MGANSDDALEAGGDFLLKQGALHDLLSRLHVNDIGQLTAFEVVLEVEGVKATPQTVRVIAQRLVKDRQLN